MRLGVLRRPHRPGAGSGAHHLEYVAEADTDQAKSAQMHRSNPPYDVRRSGRRGSSVEDRCCAGKSIFVDLLDKEVSNVNAG
jgi:hypothetical protein